jgi:molybdate transport system substrate-binding protein
MKQVRRGLVAVLVLACVGGVAAAAGAPSKPRPRGEIIVFAAASLTDVFTEIGEDFQKRHEETTVTFNFNSSSTLETQIGQGAPADAFASADTANMDELVAADLVAGEPELFARNRLAIAVAPGNPKGIETLADTVQSGVQLVLCAPEVPCGRYALEAYANAGVTVPKVPTGTSVRDTLSKVSLGEADAAVVYATDVRAARGDVDGVRIPTSVNVIAEYPIAALRESGNLATAKAFGAYVLSKPGQATLKKYGFLAP